MLKKLACLVLTVILVFSTSVATADAATMTVWGTVNKDGSIDTSSGGFTVTPPKGDSGEYIISFAPQFTSTPAVVGSIVNWGKLNENTIDNVVFPKVNQSTATAITGSSTGDHSNRPFAFIAIGFSSESDCE